MGRLVLQEQATAHLERMINEAGRKLLMHVLRTDGGTTYVALYAGRHIDLGWQLVLAGVATFEVGTWSDTR